MSGNRQQTKRERDSRGTHAWGFRGWRNANPVKKGKMRQRAGEGGAGEPRIWGDVQRNVENQQGKKET